jgi:hypothetical protein
MPGEPKPRSTTNVLVTVVALVATSAVSNSARAEAPKLAPSGRTLFAEGQRLLAAGKVVEACSKLAESDRIEPKLVVIQALAKCHQRAGRPASAIAAFREVQRRAATAKDVAADRAARDEIRALEASAPKLTITVDPTIAGLEGLDIKLDGRPLPRAEWSAPVLVDPGRHKVEVAASGKKAVSVDADVDVKQPAATAVVPPLEDVATARFVEVKEPTTIDRIGEARWESGLGFVVDVSSNKTGISDGDTTADPSAASAGSPAVQKDTTTDSPHVPELVPLHLPGFAFAFVVGATSFRASPDTSFAAPEAGIAFEYAYRERDSMFVPWGSVEVHGNVPVDSSSGMSAIVSHSGRLGVEFHPARLRWIGVGPTLGYGLAYYVPKTESSANQFGPQVGFSTRLRSAETGTKPPSLDAEFYLVQRWGGSYDAVYAGTNAVLLRPLTVYGEYRLSQSFSGAVDGVAAFASSFPAEARGGLGVTF